MIPDDADVEIVKCEGCSTLLDADHCFYDVECTPLCEQCRQYATLVVWDGEDWVACP